MTPQASPQSLTTDTFPVAAWRREILAGITTSFAMVPEVVAFAFVTHVNPLVGLYAAFVAGLITAVFGGRPGMVTGGAGSLAVVTASLVLTYGQEYLFASVVVMGLVQIAVGLLRWGKFIQMVPQPVMLGFVNGLAIVIFLAQLHNLQTPTATGMQWVWGPELWVTLGLVAVTMAVALVMPRLTRAVPGSLAAIGVTSLLTLALHLNTRTVGDLASVKGGFPSLHVPHVPLNGATLAVVVPYALMLAAVGLAESLLTLQLVDQLTATRGNNDRECVGQGLGNVASGLVGGMGACAMIGQSVINVESGGRRRLSGVVEAGCILAFILFASGIIERVPLAALTGVMFVVVLKTFAWPSLRLLPRMPRADAFVLVLVTLVTVYTNLAIAVAVGIVVSALRFAWESHLHLHTTTHDTDGRRTYTLYGPVFFTSATRFQSLFTPDTDPDHVTLDFTHAHLHDHSAHDVLERLHDEYRKLGKKLHIVNLKNDRLKNDRFSTRPGTDRAT